MTTQIFNFSAGPANLPKVVLERAQKELVSYQGVGVSVLEMSHRSKWFEAILQKAEDNLRSLLKIPSDYHVLFIQGGASLQFSMVPMNLLKNSGKKGAYLITGSWGQKAIKQAKLAGETTSLWDGKEQKYTRTPNPSEYQVNQDSVYLHFTSNETIEGVQFKNEPTSPVPLICDASSDFISRPLDISKYGLIYAGAQKNAGPSGVTIVILKNDLLKNSPQNLPAMLDYKQYVENKSMYNTPPCFSIYLVMLITDWLNDIGGLAKMDQINQKKAALLYNAIDESNGFYKGHAVKECRSLMNVTWRMPNEELENKFLDEAKAKGLIELKGHRSVGGLRASIYNAMPVEGVEKLVELMKEFKKNG